MDKILLGHTCQDNAFIVENYPYGYVLKCRIRYWIETAEKGSKKGEMRVVSQTTNPKRGPPDYWNKPNAGIYCPLLILVQREDNSHVESRGVSLWSKPEDFEAFNTILSSFDRSNPVELQHALKIQERFHGLRKVSRVYNKEAWVKFDAEKAKASGYVSDAIV